MRRLRRSLLPGLLLSSFALCPPALARAPERDRYYVEFTRPAPDAAETVRAAGGTVVHEFPELRAIAARLAAPALRALRANPNVAAVEEDPIRVPFAQTIPYGIALVQADAASGVSEDLVASRKVCVIDSGLHRDHEDLRGVPVAATADVAGTGDPFVDRCGHGTHVAGTLAALSNELGVEGVVGNGGLSLHVVKVFGDDCAWAYSSDLIAAADACAAAGANVISMSLGGGRSRFEQRKFDSLYAAGVLSVAAAGNLGTSQLSYPASYASVISVAAVDSAKVVADFSQYNSEVELAAPGVGVLSTVPWVGASLTVAGVKYLAAGIEFAATTAGVTGPLADGGLCTSTGAWSGRVVLCERGTNTFYEKVVNVQASGAVAAVIYNNVPGGFAGTLGEGFTSLLPAIGISQEDGQLLLATALGTPGTVVNSKAVGSGYEAWDGTSMATPHVSAVAALVWSHDTRWTNVQIRDALQRSAEDLGPAGWDAYSGYGLVRARAALEHLTGAPPPPPPAGITLTATGYKRGAVQYVDLAWSGAAGASVDVRRDGSLVATTANDGLYTDKIGKSQATTYVYEVCEAGTTVCSNEVTVQF